MRLGVIVCPKCKQVKGVNLSFKTTTCVRCGKKLPLRSLKIFYQTDSQEQLTQAIGRINANVNGKSNEFEKLIQTKQ
jgi:hypothetical protein